MLAIDKVQTIEGVTVYGDNKSISTFYLVADVPRFRLDENGSPVFKFLKYRMPIDRADGKKGGGYLFFDSEFVVDDVKKEAVREVLQEQVNRRWQQHPQRRSRPAPTVKFGTITYTKGTASLLLEKDGIMIEKVMNPGKPSLFGRNICPFALELSPEGATLFWEALQGKGGVVQVVYDLHFNAALPPIKAWGTFHASKFYSFTQDIDTDNSVWGEDTYTETVSETFRNSESISTGFDWGMVTDDKLRQPIRDWVTRSVEDAAERLMLEAIDPASEKDREVPEDIEDVHRNFTVNKISNFTLWYKESQPVEWFIGPRGTLPNITNLVDASGAPIRWEDHAQEVSLDDKFFQQLNVSVHANADFDALPIHSVEVHLDYAAGGSRKIEEFRFDSADDIGKFATFIEDDVREFEYWYEVNYKGETKTFKSKPETTDETILTVNVGDMGILDVEVLAGDLNFQQVPSAQVTVRYEDSGVDPIERQFTLDGNNPSHRFTKVIFQPRKGAYEYKVKYFMDNGKEVETEWQESRSPSLYINDPWNAVKEVGLRSIGDLDNTIAQIFVDLRYEDAEHDYVQTQSVALNAGTPFFDWAIPVIDETAGKVTYSGTVAYKDGTTEPIPETEATENTILVGDLAAAFLEVNVLPNLIDFAQVALAQVSFSYSDDDNGVQVREDLVFSAQDNSPKEWKIAIKDEAQQSYTWKATYFLADGSQRETGEDTTDARSLVLQMPAA